MEGHDACRKIAILSSLMTGKTVRYEDIPCEGISRITKTDFGYARNMQMGIKLLGMAHRNEDGSVNVRTAPFLVSRDHPLYSATGVFNAVFVHGNCVDDLMFYGRGAGKLPTASAVVADVVDCAVNLGRNVDVNWSDEVLAPADSSKEVRRFFIRAAAGDRDSVLSAFGPDLEEAVSDTPVADECAFVTGAMSEAAFEEAAAGIPGIRSWIRLF